MHEFNSKKINGKEKQEVLLRKDCQPEVLIVNRGMFTWLSIFILAAVFMLAFLSIPGNGLLAAYEKDKQRVDVHQIHMNPAISAEINALKSQMIGLLSGSIESKLRLLEAGVKNGNVPSEVGGVIEDLKNDLKVLKTYSNTGAGQLIAEPYAVKQVKPEAEMRNQLYNEVSQLKQLLYLSIASCGLMMAAVAGVWLRHQSLLTNQIKRKNLAGDSSK